MNFLYPADPLNPKKPDEVYSDEYTLIQKSGHQCYLFCTDDIELGTINSLPKLNNVEGLIYRGWMVTPEQYQSLENILHGNNCSLLTSAIQYKHCHYLPSWYSQFAKFTPKTVFANKDSDFESLVNILNWKKYFIKDYVKSLTTSPGSIAKNAKEIKQIISLLEKYRGQIDGGICLRKFEDLDTESEERFFIFKCEIFSRKDKIPTLIKEIVKQIDSPFYSIDIINNKQGIPRLMELGDGQVSDIKKWPLNHFIDIFNSPND